MVNFNLIAVVAFDETYVGNYNINSRAYLYIQGIEPESPEFLYRLIRANIRLQKGFLYRDDGELGFNAGAMVPDHLPALKAWDLVEVRQTGTYDTMKNFSRIGEGNAVLRVLCQRADPGYQQCAAALPRIGRYPHQGNTNAPFLKSLKDYGFTFSPAYTEEGKSVRAI